MKGEIEPMALDWREETPLMMGLRRTWQSNQRRGHDRRVAEPRLLGHPPTFPTVQ